MLSAVTVVIFFRLNQTSQVPLPRENRDNFAPTTRKYAYEHAISQLLIINKHTARGMSRSVLSQAGAGLLVDQGDRVFGNNIAPKKEKWGVN